MCVVDIILIQIDLKRRRLYQSARNKSVVSRAVGKKKVVVCGTMEGEQILNNLCKIPTLDKCEAQTGYFTSRHLAKSPSQGLHPLFHLMS